MITCNSQVPPFFGVPFLGGRKRYGSYFLSPSPSRSLRVARDLCFAQRARGPGPLGKMFSATLAIANAVQFKCTRVLIFAPPARRLRFEQLQGVGQPTAPVASLHSTRKGSGKLAAHRKWRPPARFGSMTRGSSVGGDPK